ncbi:hypothetical protein VDG1235_2974 [Verrucomicrobiia bacterium DG1235]|nr:hypothetical protein VDG1235_2974 [Verrucomicrobiae bacterium DG1235]
MKKIDASLKAHWRSIKSGTFDQDTIKSLFLTIREIAPRNSLARDLGDALAHSDRNRGIVFEQIGIFRQEDRLNENGSKTVTITIPTPQDAVSFCRGIITAFLERKITKKNEALSVINELLNDMVVTIFCLLQHSTITIDKNKKYELRIVGNTSFNQDGKPLMSLAAFSETGDPFVAFSSDVIYSDYFDEDVSEKNLFAFRQSNKLEIERI